MTAADAVKMAQDAVREDDRRMEERMDAVEAASRGPASSSSEAGPRVVVHAASVSSPARRERTEGAEATGVPFTFVDVRPADEYARSHIVGALSLPIAAVHADKIPHLLLALRHRAGHSVVVYDEHGASGGPAEELAIKLSNTGYPNTFLLTGGYAHVLSYMSSVRVRAVTRGAAVDGDADVHRLLEGTHADAELEAAIAAVMSSSPARPSGRVHTRAHTHAGVDADASEMSPSRGGNSIRSGISVATSRGGSHIHMPASVRGVLTAHTHARTGTFGAAHRFAGIRE